MEDIATMKGSYLIPQKMNGLYAKNHVASAKASKNTPARNHSHKTSHKNLYFQSFFSEITHDVSFQAKHAVGSIAITQG